MEELKKEGEELNNKEFNGGKTEQEKILDHVRLKLKKEKTLELSIKEGSATAVMSGAGETYIVPYALALNATNVQIGFLSSFVSLFGAWSQIIGSKLVYKYSRKNLIVRSVLLQAFMWILILVLGILFWKGIINGFAAGILIVLYCLYAISGNLAGPAWFSLMGDLIPEEKRGEYFSRRNKIIGLVAIIVTIGASIWLDYTKELGLVIIGFTVLFAIASVSRFISAYYFTKHYYPRREVKKDSYFGFFDFMKKAPTNNFGRFTIYIALINFATYFAAPFFTVYMLKELNYSYVLFMIVALSASLFTIISLPMWGKVGDKYGNRELMKIGGIIIPFTPLLWVFSGNPIYLILTAQLTAGVGWAAFNLGTSNFIYDAVTPQKRSICVAYFNMISGFGIFFGAVAGGLFAQYVHFTWINTFLLVFIVSAVARAIISLIFFRRIKEVRNVEDEKNIHVFTYFHMLAPKPFFGLNKGIHEMTHHKGEEKI
ncbi:MAG: MFS transporter [Nanoarchaeota archaeon]